MFFATRYIHCEDSSCSEAPVPLVQLQHINGQIIMMPKQANTDTTTVSWEFFLCFDISFLFVCFVFLILLIFGTNILFQDCSYVRRSSASVGDIDIVIIMVS